VILAALWGLDPEKDFQVTTAPWRIGPEKLLGKEADVTLNAMPFVLKNLQAKKFRMVGKSFATAWAETRGKGRRLGGLFWAAWQAWLNQNLKPARALLGAWAEGMTYARRNTGPWAEKYLPAASRETSKEEIRYFARWFQEERPVYPTPYLSQADIEDETAFLKLAVKQKMVRAMPKKPIWQIVRPR
jgi:hypothetical protein